MAKSKNSGLGRGFGSLLYDNSIETEVAAPVNTVKISDVQPRAGQPRKNFDEEALEALSSSIAQHGLIQPIVVRKADAGFYEIIAGERRWRAAKLAGLMEVPVTVIEADDQKTAELSLIENIQREDLDPIEEARAYRALIDEYGLTQEEVAEQVSKSRSAVTNTLRLLDLPDKVLKMISDKEISEGHGRAILGLKKEYVTQEDENGVTSFVADPTGMVLAAEVVVKENLSVRQTEELVKRMNRNHTSVPKITADTKREVDYAAVLEKKLQSNLGRRVTIKNSGKVKTLTLEYTDNDDLETLIVKLCGKEVLSDW